MFYSISISDEDGQNYRFISSRPEHKLGLKPSQDDSFLRTPNIFGRKKLKNNRGIFQDQSLLLRPCGDFTTRISTTPFNCKKNNDVVNNNLLGCIYMYNQRK